MAYNGPLPQVVRAGGSGAATLTGVLIGNGTSAFTGNAVTQYDVLVGGASNAISSVGPGSLGQVLQSAGNASNPAYSTATYPLTTTINQILYSSSANVVAGLSTANNGLLITGTTGIPSILANGTTGQVLTATTGSPPSWISPATSGTVTSVSVVSANGFAGTVATATTTPAITLTTTATGVLSGNGTAISGSAVTQFDVLVGGASNAISSVGPGSAGQVLQSGGNAANPVYSTATYPATATGTGKILRADGTNWAATTATYPNTAGTSGNVLTSDGTNWNSSAPATVITSGTWTPTLVGGSTAGSTTYAQQNGYYTQIGSTMFIWGYVGISAATGTGDMTLGGFPATIKSQTAYQPIGPVFWQGSTNWTFPAATTSLSLSGVAGSTTANVYAAGSAVAGGNMQMHNGSLFCLFSLNYQV